MRHHHELGRGLWKLVPHCNRVRRQRVEAADSGRHVPPGAGPHLLEVISSLFFPIQSINVQLVFTRTRLPPQVAPRIRQVAGGQQEGRSCPPLPHPVCSHEPQSQVHGDCHTECIRFLPPLPSWLHLEAPAVTCSRGL